MRLNTADAAFLVGDAAALAAMPGTPPLEPFSPRVLDLFDTLSKALLSRPEARRFPDLAALAFWCRRAAMEERRKPYLDGEFRLGRGMALHIAPGNVPLNFAYSLAAGLLAGNANAVRLPSEPFPQAALVCAALEELLAGAFSDLRPYAACLRYPRESGLTEALSALCDARIIWGGDETVRRVRAFPLKPRAAEICFADRWSACVIDSGTYLAHADRDALARNFYNDTYLNDQRSCAAPRAVLWLGEREGEARADFWPRVEAIAAAEYDWPAALAVAKREAFCRIAADCPGARLLTRGNLLVRVELPALTPAAMELHPGGGFFLEAAADSLDALLPVCGEKCQTVTHYGVKREAFRAFLRAHRPRGADRMVPIGRALEFSLTWDGVDLIRRLSRAAVCEASVKEDPT